MRPVPDSRECGALFKNKSQNEDGDYETIILSIS